MKFGLDQKVEFKSVITKVAKIFVHFAWYRQK